jgi:hypothetical protein
MKKKNHQYAIIEFDNCAPFVYRLVSDKAITIDDASKYFEVTEGFSEDRDSITFIDDILDLDISKLEDIEEDEEE